MRETFRVEEVGRVVVGLEAERRARGERVMVEWGGVLTSCRRRREGVGMMWLERARGGGSGGEDGQGDAGVAGDTGGAGNRQETGHLIISLALTGGDANGECGADEGGCTGWRSGGKGRSWRRERREERLT